MYEQGTDVRLLTALLLRLENKTVVDAGAERGGFTQAFLDHGAEKVFAIEPYPPNVSALQKRFGAHPQVQILPLALGERNETATLHLIEDRAGDNVSSYHSLAHASETPLLHTVGTLPVACRTLDSLAAEGALPARVGILKIDAEGNDLAILRGMGDFFATVVMIEYWDDLPDAVGPSPFALADADQFMKARGYRQCAVIKRRDEFETLELNDDRTRPGDWGNAIFLHESAFPQMPKEVVEAAVAVHASLIDKAVLFRTECVKRLQVIEEQARAIEQFREQLKPAPFSVRLQRLFRPE